MAKSFGKRRNKKKSSRKSFGRKKSCRKSFGKRRRKSFGKRRRKSFGKRRRKSFGRNPNLLQIMSNTSPYDMSIGQVYRGTPDSQYLNHYKNTTINNRQNYYKMNPV